MRSAPSSGRSLRASRRGDALLYTPLSSVHVRAALFDTQRQDSDTRALTFSLRLLLGLDWPHRSLTGASAGEGGVPGHTGADHRVASDLPDVARRLARLARQLGRLIAVLVLDEPMRRVDRLRRDLGDAVESAWPSPIHAPRPDGRARVADLPRRRLDGLARVALLRFGRRRSHRLGQLRAQSRRCARDGAGGPRRVLGGRAGRCEVSKSAVVADRPDRAPSTIDLVASLNCVGWAAPDDEEMWLGAQLHSDAVRRTHPLCR